MVFIELNVTNKDFVDAKCEAIEVLYIIVNNFYFDNEVIKKGEDILKTCLSVLNSFYSSAKEKQKSLILITKVVNQINVYEKMEALYNHLFSIISSQQEKSKCGMLHTLCCLLQL